MSNRTAYNRAWRARNPHYNKQERDAWLARMDTYIDECVDCGNEDPVVLEFDHVFAEPARYSNGNRVPFTAMKGPKLLREIAKCEVRCRNCHRKRHVMEGHTRDWASKSSPLGQSVRPNVYEFTKPKPVDPQLRLDVA